MQGLEFRAGYIGCIGGPAREYIRWTPSPKP